MTSRGASLERISSSWLLSRLAGVSVLTGSLTWLHFALYKAYFFGYAAAAFVSVLLWLSGHASLKGALRPLLPMALLLAYVGLSALWTPSPEDFLEVMPALGAMAIVYLVGFVLGRNCTMRDTQVFFAVFNGSGLLSVLYIVLQHDSITAAEVGSFRTVVASVLCISLPFLVRGAVEQRSRVAILLVCLNVIAALFIGSRILLLAAPVIITMALVTYSSTRRQGMRRLGFALGVIIVGSIAYLSGERILGLESSLNRFTPEQFSLDLAGAEDDLRNPTDERADYVRRLMFNVAMDEFAGAPLFGIGFMGIRSVMEAKYGISVTGHGALAFAAELGLIGCALLIGILRYFFRSVARVWDGRVSAYRQSMIAVAFVGLFHQFVESPYLYLIYGVGIGFAERVGAKRARVE